MPDYPSLTTSKNILDFHIGMEGCPLNSIVVDTVVFKNDSNNDIKVTWETVQSPLYLLQIELEKKAVNGIIRKVWTTTLSDFN